MHHLILSREFPPSTYPRGGIGTYVEQLSRLLAERGEIVHVIAELWDGAPLVREIREDGRLVIHRVPLGRPLPRPIGPADSDAPDVLEAMAASEFPAQSFSWQAALLAESLVESEGIDVIEAQDYEAPLYYFLLRRALGMGPEICPPCVVHLHSPWEFICQSNDWGLASGYDVTIKRLEDYAITAADARMCPSRFLAAQAEAHYGLETGSTEVLPYPVGDAPLIERPSDVWNSGSILYFGRMEPRKGVLEWIQAAVELAAERPTLRFDFIGADTSLTGDRGPSVRAALEAAVPEALKSSFRFEDAQPRERLWQRLADAQLVVVPSRWENFPLTCIEAMSSGLPVVASRNGGMVEIVEDGRTGWLASSTSRPDLTNAVRRALDRPAPAKAEMGRAAAAAIRRICDDRTTVDAHIEFRGRLARSATTRSMRVPALPSWTPPLSSLVPSNDASVRREARHRASLHISESRKGIALILVGSVPSFFETCAESIRSQTHAPHSVIVASSHDSSADLVTKARDAGWRVVASPTLAEIDQEGEPMSGSRALGVAIVDVRARLHPTFVEASTRALERQNDLGIVSAWFRLDSRSGRLSVRPGPALPYQWLADDMAPAGVFRMTAVLEIPTVRDTPVGVLPVDEMAAAVLAEGWLSVTYPAALSVVDDEGRIDADLARSKQAARLQIRAATISRHPERLAGEAPLFLHLLQARSSQDTSVPPRHVGRGALSPEAIRLLPLGEQLKLVRRALRNPRYATSWLAWHGRRLLRGR